MGCEVYDNTEAELDLATSPADLNILFSTQNIPGSYICDRDIIQNPEYTVEVHNYSFNSCISGVNGFDDWIMDYYVCPTEYASGIYHTRQDYLYITVDGTNPVYVILYLDNVELGRQLVFGYGTAGFYIGGLIGNFGILVQD
jgi:hypothetical protein